MAQGNRSGTTEIKQLIDWRAFVALDPQDSHPILYASGTCAKMYQEIRRAEPAGYIKGVGFVVTEQHESFVISQRPGAPTGYEPGIDVSERLEWYLDAAVKNPDLVHRLDQDIRHDNLSYELLEASALDDRN